MSCEVYDTLGQYEIIVGIIVNVTKLYFYDDIYIFTGFYARYIAFSACRVAGRFLRKILSVVEGID